MLRSKAALVSGASGLLIALSGCSAIPKVKTIKVPVVKYVSVPDSYTSPVPIEQPENNTVGECVRVARVRKSELQQCNAQLKAIRELGDGS